MELISGEWFHVSTFLNLPTWLLTAGIQCYYVSLLWPPNLNTSKLDTRTVEIYFLVSVGLMSRGKLDSGKPVLLGLQNNFLTLSTVPLACLYKLKELVCHYCKDTSPIRLVPTSRTLFYCNCFPKSPLSKYSDTGIQDMNIWIVGLQLNLRH